MGWVPFAMLGIGLAGSAWLWLSGEGVALAVTALVATLILSVLGRLAAEATVQPSFVPQQPASDHRAEDEPGRGILAFEANIAMAPPLLAYHVTPQVLLWALAFAATMRMAWWAAQSGAPAPVSLPAAGPQEAPIAETLRRAA